MQITNNPSGGLSSTETIIPYITRQMAKDFTVAELELIFWPHLGDTATRALEKRKPTKKGGKSC